MNVQKSYLSGKDWPQTRVALLGLGVSNQAALHYLRKKGAQIFLISGGPPPEELAPFLSYTPQDDEQAEQVLGSMDLIILSPGISRTLSILNLAHLKKIPLISEIELALRHFKKIPCLAVTGSNGKTTTVSLIAQMIQNSGYECALAGNIGTPLCQLALDAQEYDYLVLELSSFQLESTPSLRPHAAAILNLTPNHAERYHRHEDYALAKCRVAQKMDEYGLLLIDEKDMLTARLLQTKAFIQMIQEKKAGIDFSELKLIGEHNRRNIWVAITMIQHVVGEFEKGIKKTIAEFSGIEHRLEYIPFPGRRIYNDAKSTNWLATSVAVKGISELLGIKYLILGGKARGKNDLPPEEIMELLKKEINNIYLIGEMGFRIEEFFKIHGIESTLKETMKDAVDEIMELMGDNDVLLLSPAAPSFDQFRDYKDRGEQFKKYILSKK